MEPLDVRELVVRTVAQMAGIEPSSLGEEATLESIGLDSADAVILSMEVEQFIGKEIDVGLFLRCATIAEAAAEIVKMVELEKL